MTKISKIFFYDEYYTIEERCTEVDFKEGGGLERCNSLMYVGFRTDTKVRKK